MSRAWIKPAVRVAVVLSAAAATVGGFIVWRAHRGLSAAQSAVDGESWQIAREHLMRYLWLHPGDDAAHLLLAEAWIRDDGIPADRSAAKAIEHLQRIDDTSQQAAQARLHEARIHLLVMHQPIRAQALLERSLELEPDGYEANELMWKLLDMTERSHLAEPHFWKAYEVADVGRQPALLRTWYVSQFTVAGVNADLDRRMGFLGPSEPATAASEYRRLQRFREREPDSPVCHAALARWSHRNRDRNTALKLLGEAAKLPGAFDDAFFVASYVELLVDYGRFDDALACLARWPQPRVGYEFWKWHGILQDEARSDAAAAVAAYEKAEHHWPGGLDWPLMIRRANALQRMGRTAQAEELRRRAKSVEKLLELNLHKELRTALLDLKSASTLQQMECLYRRLGRNREGDCWRTHRERPAGDR